MEDSYTFTVTSELEMKSKSDSLEIPTFSCLATKDVSREKGMIAIEARTNVEVEEIKSSGLGSLGVNEVRQIFIFLTLTDLGRFIFDEQRLCVAWIQVFVYVVVSTLRNSQIPTTTLLSTSRNTLMLEFLLLLLMLLRSVPLSLLRYKQKLCLCI